MVGTLDDQIGRFPVPIRGGHFLVDDLTLTCWAGERLSSTLLALALRDPLAEVARDDQVVDDRPQKAPCAPSRAAASPDGLLVSLPPIRRLRRPPGQL